MQFMRAQSMSKEKQQKMLTAIGFTSATAFDTKVTPVTWNPKWRRWYGQFYNHYSKSMNASTGNLRYKIWNPLEHWDHHFVNGEDDRDGVWSRETLLMKEGTDPRTGIAAVSHKIDLTEYGLGRDFLQEMEENNCRADAAASSQSASAGDDLFSALTQEEQATLKTIMTKLISTWLRQN